MVYAQAQQDLFVIMINKKKCNGCYLEIGGGNAIEISNTYYLEKDFQWYGVIIDMNETYRREYEEFRPLAKYIISDARSVDYMSVLSELPKHIDYLQIDLEVYDRSTLDVLEKFDSFIFDIYKFGVVTFEHDIYRGDWFNTRQESRRIFEKHGYIRVFSDVQVFSGEKNQWYPFEDWYVHPDIIEQELICSLIQDPDNVQGIPCDDCTTILQRYL